MLTLVEKRRRGYVILTMLLTLLFLPPSLLF
jgi:hypothetical protein